MNNVLISPIGLVLSALVSAAAAISLLNAAETDEQAVESLLLERFDVNNDRRLDTNEKAVARERLRHLLEDRTGFPLHIEDIADAQIANLLQAFDENNNRQLNSDEQERFRHVVHRLLDDQQHLQADAEKGSAGTRRKAGSRPASRQETRRRIQAQRRRQSNGNRSSARGRDTGSSSAGGGSAFSGASSSRAGGRSRPVGAG